MGSLDEKSLLNNPPSPTHLNIGNVVNNQLTHHFYGGNAVEHPSPAKRSPSQSSERVNGNGRDIPLSTPFSPSSPVPIPQINPLGNLSNDPVSISGVSANKAENKQKVPLEFSHTLPAKCPLGTGNIQAETFMLWKGKVISSVEKIPKFTGIFSYSLMDSWKYFKSRNQSKYDDESLQNHYIDCHQEIYGFLMECVDEKFATQLEREFKAGNEKLTTLLNFTVNHPAAYKNAYLLMEKISKYHIQTSRWKAAEILSKFCAINYNGSDDPKVFIAKFHDFNYTGRLLGGDQGWPNFPDEFMANFMYGKLVGNALSSVRTCLQTLENTRPVTLKDVEDQLIAWWLSKDASKGSSSNEKQPYGGKPFNQNNSNQKKSTNQNSSQEGHSANVAQPVPKEKSVKFGKSPGKSILKSPHQREEGETQSSQNDDFDNEISVVAIADIDDDESTNSGNDTESEYANSSVKEVYPINYHPQRHEMLWDTGATTSMTPLQDKCESTKPINPIKISTMSGHTTAKTVGTFRFKGKIRLENIHIIPTAPYSLFSLSKATANGCIAVFTGEDSFLLPKNSRNNAILDICENHSVFHGLRKGNLWVTDMYDPSKETDQIDEGFHREKGKQITFTTPEKSRQVPPKDNPSKLPSTAVAPAKTQSKDDEKKEPKGPSPAKRALFTPPPNPSIRVPRKQPNASASQANVFDALLEDGDTNSDLSQLSDSEAEGDEL
jgi:hypothetical protein